ncbi:AraC family transcriptional regulator [Roseibium sp. MMSF_3544]|uniref:AraC family transcriptional regulator n=1 Tax=unclassified Roseibium TaxID=2629323 RepID=UPI00273CF96B|nr:AraC family transcriptional regulator [Roseibium sp. MMSF_3544]
MSSDPLTDIVGSLDLMGAVFLNAEFTAPWAITAHVTEEDCRPFMPVPRQVIAYHVVKEGEAIVSLDQSEGYREHRRVKVGDVVFLPSNEQHVLASGTGENPICGDDLLLPAGQDGLVRIVHGGGGARTRILCGFMASNSVPNPLLDTLPKLLVINIESLETRRWIEASVAMAARKFTASRDSSDAMVSGLCRLLLIEALRNHVEQQSSPGGWLNGMAHPRIGRALARIHTNLSASLRVEELAAEIGMSRSAFVDRFTEVMSMGPRKYILAQRMEAATVLLRETGLSTAEIAYRVGYDAPEAFSRAFKRETGYSPIELRDLREEPATRADAVVRNGTCS